MTNEIKSQSSKFKVQTKFEIQNSNQHKLVKIGINQCLEN